MRGKLAFDVCRAYRRGITPADAGKTAQPAFAAENLGDHPRGCGENMTANLREWRHFGSPPRMRGKLYTQL